MTINNNQMTAHVRNDRADRLAIIGAAIGFGDEMLRERFSPLKDSWSCFMDSGAMLIWNHNKTKLVTGFVPSIEQVTWVYGRPVNKAIQKLVSQAQKKYQKMLGK